MQEKVLILDFGSQYTQLIARRVRELFIYCEIYPYNNPPEKIAVFPESSPLAIPLVVQYEIIGSNAKT